MLFFSYSRGNLLVVRSIAAELRRLGYRTWIDLENLKPGERWRDVIERALAASDAMVFCISRLSLDSAWTSVELRAAQDRGLQVVPLLIDDVPIGGLPPTLRDVHLIDTAGWEGQDLPARAAFAIAGCVKPQAASPSSSAGEAAATLRVDIVLRDCGAVAIGWVSGHSRSPAAPLAAHALVELARAADEVRAAEVHIDGAIPSVTTALVLGTLAGRLGPGRVRLHVDTQTARALGDVARCIGATVVDAQPCASEVLPDAQPFVSEVLPAMSSSVAMAGAAEAARLTQPISRRTA